MREREKCPDGVPSILVLPILLLSYTLLTVQLKYYFCSSPMTFPMFVRSNIVCYTASLRYDVHATRPTASAYTIHFIYRKDILMAMRRYIVWNFSSRVENISRWAMQSSLAKYFFKVKEKFCISKLRSNVLLFYFINTNEIHFNSFLSQYIGAIYHVAIATVIFSHDNMLFPCK